MEHPLTAAEMEVFMDISFLFNSVLDIKMLTSKYLQLLGKLVPYEKAAIFLFHEQGQRLHPCAEIRCERALLGDYIERYHAMDYLGWLLYQNGMGSVRESDKLSLAEKERTPFYKDFIRLYGIRHRLLFNMESAEGRLLGAGMLFRSEAFEDFTPRELAIFERLRRHFAAALDHALRFESLTRSGNRAKTVLHEIAESMLVLDENLEISYSNERGGAFLEKLKARPPEEKAFFASLHEACRALEESFVASEGGRVREGEPVLLCGEKATLSLIAADDPLSTESHEFIVMLTNTTRAVQTKASEEGQKADTKERVQRFFAVLVKQYSLTRRELRLMELAIEGLENREIAEALHISLFTVKSHFQNSYAKLGIKSRQELFLVYMKYIVSEEFRQSFEAQTRKDEAF